MKKEFWLIPFIIALAANIISAQVNSDLLQYISKPLIIFFLAGYFLSNTTATKSALKKGVLAALFFSWCGDILLMFVAKNEIFFLLGLASFLIAHIIYGLIFSKIMKVEKIDRNIFLFIFPYIYVIILLRYLSPSLGDMKWPVIIYACIIGAMFSTAAHLTNGINKSAGYKIGVGALLFVISDSVLAIDKFYQPFKEAGVIIMLTYGLAQLFIVKGAASYINSNHGLHDLNGFKD